MRNHHIIVLSLVLAESNFKVGIVLMPELVNYLRHSTICTLRWLDSCDIAASGTLFIFNSIYNGHCYGTT